MLHTSMSRLSKTLCQLAVAASLLLAPTVALAHPGPSRAGVSNAASTASSISREDDARDPLAGLDDEGLASRRAAHHDHWTTGEIVLVVVLLIICFPLGLIVLIVILLTHDD